MTDGAEDPSIESVWQMLDPSRDVLSEFTEVFGNVKSFRSILQDSFVEDYYGSGYIRIHRRENYDSYSESSRRYEREFGRKHREEDRKLQNRRRSNRNTRSEISQSKVREDAFLYDAVSLSNERVDSLISDYAAILWTENAV